MSTEAGTPTGSKSTTIARTRGFKSANTPRTEATPAAPLQHNIGVQPPKTSIGETAPALHLQQESNVQLANTPISETVPASKLNQNTSLVGIGGSNLSPPPGGWKPLLNPANRAGSESGVSAVGGSSGVGHLPPPPIPTYTSQPINQANGPQTQLPPPPAVGPTIIPFNPANGPQTEGAPNGGQMPPGVMSTGYPGNAENNSISEVAPTVQFKQNRRIEGSDRWVDSNYDVFRNYRSEWHDRDWWRSHYSHIAFGVGGWYYRNASYWFPAWGYDPNAYYAYDGPIYAHKGLPPDQVIADVQESLQKQGYYRGDVDGLLGSPTRAAISDYQRDHKLYVTSAIDSPTLQSLGMR